MGVWGQVMKIKYHITRPDLKIDMIDGAGKLEAYGPGHIRLVDGLYGFIIENKCHDAKPNPIIEPRIS
jgi:hypothetical protein